MEEGVVIFNEDTQNNYVSVITEYKQHHGSKMQLKNISPFPQCMLCELTNLNMHTKC